MNSTRRITSYKLLVPVIDPASGTATAPPPPQEQQQQLVFCSLTNTFMPAKKQQPYHPESPQVAELGPALLQAKRGSQQQQQPEYASRRGEAIVLIHGLNGNLRTWTDVAGPLSAATGLPVLIFDQTAHGENSETFSDLAQLERSLRPENLARDLMELLVDLGFVGQQQQNQTSVITTKFHLFGQSYGTKTMLAFADRYPRFVASIALGDLGVRANPKANGRGIELARILAAEAKKQHSDFFSSEDEVREYIQRVFACGDDPGKKFVLHEEGEDDDDDGGGASMMNNRSGSSNDDTCCPFVACFFGGGGGGGGIGGQNDSDDHSAQPQQQQQQQFRVLFRPHVGLLHEAICRASDFVDTFSDLDSSIPVLLLRADDEFTCLSDDEVSLMKELRGSGSLSVVRVAGGHHGVHRSHPAEWVKIVGGFFSR